MRYLWLIFLFALPVQAQQACDPAVQAAYASAALECAETMPPARFATAADHWTSAPWLPVISPALATASAGLQSLDSAPGAIALARFSANHPDHVVTMLIVGELSLKNSQSGPAARDHPPAARHIQVRGQSARPACRGC